MEQIQAQAQAQHNEEGENEVEIVCEVFHKQSLLNVEPVHQAQNVLGTYDNWHDAVQILQEVVDPREIAYVILPGQPPRIVCYDHKGKVSSIIKNRIENINW